MRITKIAVKGLFGMFDHEIPLNQESRITIVHGPNGVGKTVLMRMVQGLFNFDYEYIGSVPFGTFEVEFDDNRGIRVINVADVSRLMIGMLKAPSSLFRRLGVVGKDVVDDTVFPLQTNLDDDVVSRLAEDVLGGQYVHLRIGWKSYWLDNEFIEEELTGLRPVAVDRLLSVNDLLEKHPQIHNDVHGEMPEWFASMRQETKPLLIDTERLVNGPVDVVDLPYFMIDEDERDYRLPTTALAVADLASKIAAKLGDIDLDLERDVYSKMGESPELIQMINDAIIESAAESNPEAPKLRQIRARISGYMEGFCGVLFLRPTE